MRNVSLDRIRRFVPCALAPAIMLASGATVAAAQATPVAGTVFEATSGLPVPNVEVRVLGTTHVVRTDSAGAFSFKLDPGR